MGCGIAHVFALHGHPVHLVDLSPVALERAFVSIRRNLDRQGVAHPEEVLSRIVSFSEMHEAVAHADLVIEAVPEDMALKRTVFSGLDAAAPAHACWRAIHPPYPLLHCFGLLPVPGRSLVCISSIRFRL